MRKLSFALAALLSSGIAFFMERAHAQPVKPLSAIERLDASQEQLILAQMITTIDKSMNTYVKLSKTLLGYAKRIGKKKAGSNDRSKLITQANKAASTYISEENKIYKTFKALDTQKGDSGVLAIVSTYYSSLHKDLLKTKSRVLRRFGTLKTATVGAAVPSFGIIEAETVPISTAAADQCLNGLANQYSNQMKQLSDQAANVKDPYQGWAVRVGFEQARNNFEMLELVQSKLKNSASFDAYNNFIAAQNAEVASFNAGVNNLNALSKKHPIITHSH